MPCEPAPMLPAPTSVLPVQVQPRQPGAAPITGGAAGRPGPVWPLLAASLAALTTADRAPTVLDCGGGSGSFAVPLAQAGAAVTVVDISADALATLRRRAEDAAVADRVHAVQGDVEALADAIGERPFDLVLAHGILAAVDDVPAGFAAIAGRVRPGGGLSVLVANPVAGVLARAMAGEFAAALDELHQFTGRRVPAGPEAVRRLCADNGFEISAVHGVGVFGELIPGRALDAPGAREALDRLEADSAAHAPFRDIAARVHLLARRAGG